MYFTYIYRLLMKYPVLHNNGWLSFNTETEVKERILVFHAWSLMVLFWCRQETLLKTITSQVKNSFNLPSMYMPLCLFWWHITFKYMFRRPNPHLYIITPLTVSRIIYACWAFWAKRVYIACSKYVKCLFSAWKQILMFTVIKL